MKERFKQLSGQEKKVQIHRIVAHCEQLAENYVRTWTPANAEWETIEGCAYLRLSTDEQVAVEKGSLEQQVNIAVSEAVHRSSSERVNYKITKFYIEPGLTGRNDRRPRFQELTKAITNRQHSFVIFKEIARIARETEIWKKFFNLCISRRCQIFIRGLPFNPNDPTQVLQLDILAAFAAYESNVNSKRTKESNFSAMISSGKFNSTHKVLGLDQLLVNGEPQVGFYTRNDEEMKVVEWIMRTFVKYASYQKVLEECEKAGVKNKSGKPFLRHSLITLLTNTKYIGQWEVNAENKAERQDRLMAYDCYKMVELPHGCVIDRKLWDTVQATVKRIAGNNLGKSTAVRRVNPLVGVLKFKDGTTFGGAAGWGKAGRLNYYYNTRHKIRLKAEPIESITLETVSKLIENSAELRDAIRRKGMQTTSAMQLLSGEIEKQKVALVAVQQSQDVLNTRLDFLLKDGNMVEAEALKQEYGADRARLKAERERIEHILARLSEQKRGLEQDSFDWKALGGNAKRVMDVIAEHDPVALKNAYGLLFEAVVVGDLDAKGVRPLEFIVRNENAPAAFVTAEANLSDTKVLG
jgi:site-specific DNA recombinase